MRKSPVRHQVNSYTRNGTRIRAYLRGSGRKKLTAIANPTLSPKGYVVNFTFPDKTKETVKVISTSYNAAIDEAFEEKVSKQEPVEIHIIDPSLGEIVSWARQRVSTTAKKVWSEAKKAHHDYQTRELIRKAYSSDPVTKAFARSKLKSEHPEVWDVMDISHSSFKIPNH